MSEVDPDADDGRREAILARTAELVADAPIETAAEQEERRRRNRVASIMEPSPPAELVIRKVKDNTLIESPVARACRERRQADAVRKIQLEEKIDAGGRWTEAERRLWWSIHSANLIDDIDDLVRARKTTDAFLRLVIEFANVAISQTLKREMLEDRVDRIEAAVAGRQAAAPKPRIRVAAISRPRAA